MSIGDPGPYLNDDGDIWVPRTVPYLAARQLAKSIQTERGHVLRYVGKTDTRLFGFVRDCRCEEYCERDDEACRVPAWHFRDVEL